MSSNVITLGGGCFWCLDAVFRKMKGIINVNSGYSGGKTVNPTYEQVCSGTTGHAEVVQLNFDSNVLSLEEILKVFFSIHDPTTLNRQGNDIGTQYRSIILYHNQQQREIAEKYIKYLESEKRWNKSIVTELAPFKIFYGAEGYHQDYYTENPKQNYCRYVIEPKVEKFEKEFSLYLD